MDQSQATTRTLSLEEAIALAVLLQKHGQLDDAAVMYREVLEAAPGHPDALHYAGVLAHQQGRPHEAVALIEQSLAVLPDRADCYNNLGIVLQSAGRLDEALAAYERAMALDPAHADAHGNRGVLLKALGRTAQAEAAYRTAIRLNPVHADAYVNLGILLGGQGRAEDAAACYCKAITLRPRHRESRRLLALAHCALGETDEAVRIFEEWLSEDPDDPVACHMLAACTGRDVPGRASDAFVTTTFDGFAASFEAKLAALSYRAPALVAALIEDALEPSKALDVLDAGCGTGLCGPLVAPYARHLTGVDLSAGMLAHAADKRVYDELAQGELTEYLRRHADAFDLIVSADTLVYFGDLSGVMAAAARALHPAGLLVFTLEDAAGRDADAGFRLEQHGRYSHARSYVERVLESEGLRPHVLHADLRMESGTPVAGLVIRATKPAGGMPSPTASPP